MDIKLYTTICEHSTYYYALKFMDLPRLLQLPLSLTRFLAAYGLKQIANFKSRSAAIGYIFMLLIATSIVETLVIGIFRAVRALLIVALISLLGTELFKLLSNVPLKDEGNGAVQNMEE
jgi:hypothetical protein